MKVITFLAASALAFTPAIRAQNLTPAPGYSATAVFSVGSGFTVTGLGSDAAGNLYSLENGPFGGGLNETRLFKRAAGNFSSAVQLYSYGQSVSGNFIQVVGSTVYFGEGLGTTGTIRAIDVSGGPLLKTFAVPTNYSFAAGISGAFVSANSSDNPENKVFKLNLSTGVLDTILSTTDYSGAVAVAADGRLLYGATTFGGMNGGIFSVDAAQIAGVTDANPAQTDRAISLTGSSTPLIANGNNQYLSYLDDQHLYQSDSPFYDPTEPIVPKFAKVRRFSLSTGFLEDVASALVGPTGPFLGAMTLSGSELFTVITTDYSNGPSAVYRLAAVPEPGAVSFVLLGAVGLLNARRSRRFSV